MLQLVQCTHDVTGRWPATSCVHYTTSCNTQSSAPKDGQNNCPKHVELTGIINKPLLLHLVGCRYYLYQWFTVKQISDSEIYLLIKYIKSVLWRVEKRLSYIEDARCLKFKVEEMFRSCEPGVPGKIYFVSCLERVWQNKLRPFLECSFTQRLLIFVYRRFRLAYRSFLQGSSSPWYAE